MAVTVRVLWVAFACAPGRGSEPGLAWGLMRHLAPYLDALVVLTPAHNREAIEAGPAPPANVRLEYVPAPRLPGEAGHRLAYLVWLSRALKRARELHAQEPFDLAHHVTYAMSWIPPLPGRLGVPFVWNAGNTLTTPLRFLSPWVARATVQELVRNLAVWAGWRAARGLIRPDVVVLGHVGGDGTGRPLFLPALEPGELEAIATARSGGDTFRVATAGRLLYWKGIHLAIEAFARAARAGWEFVVVGSGPEEGRLRRLAERLGVAGKVRFLGWLPRPEVLRLLGDCDAFVLPSLHDSFSWAVLEAMAAGLPVVCLDRGGPGLVVDDGVGVKVPVRRPGQVVADLARALRELAADPGRRRAIGAEARRRVLERHTWEVRAREVLALYEEVLARRRAGHRRPAGGTPGRPPRTSGGW